MPSALGKEGFFLAAFGHESLLELIGVTVRTGNGTVPVLDNIHLTVRPGEWITIAGANGSGKSTLIGLIAGWILPDEGTVKRGFAGEKPIPWVMQQDGPHMGDTPLEETLFVLEMRGEPADSLKAKAGEALGKAGLWPVRHRRMDALSGGRRQLVQAAACLAVDAPLLLFDEATSMLDGRSRKLVRDTALRICREGKTVIWCTHRLEEAVPGGRIVVLESGKIVHDGITVSFFYNEGPDGLTACERLGFHPPFVVRTARELKKLGRETIGCPLDGSDLLHALAEVKADEG